MTTSFRWGLNWLFNDADFGLKLQSPHRGVTVLLEELFVRVIWITTLPLTCPCLVPIYEFWKLHKIKFCFEGIFNYGNSHRWQMTFWNLGLTPATVFRLSRVDYFRNRAMHLHYVKFIIIFFLPMASSLVECFVYTCACQRSKLITLMTTRLSITQLETVSVVTNVFVFLLLFYRQMRQFPWLWMYLLFYCSSFSQVCHDCQTPPSHVYYIKQPH